MQSTFRDDIAYDLGAMVRLICCLSSLLLVGTCPSSAEDESRPPGVPRLTLRELERVALQHYPELAIVAAERDAALALVDLAHRTRTTPTVESLALVGLVPAARGDIFASPDTPRSPPALGPSYRFRLEASQPLYTFGRIRDAEHAATTLLESRDARMEAKRDVARGLAARAYFGYLAAEEALALFADVQKHLDDLLERLEHPRADDAETEPIDLYKVKTYGFELARLRAEATRQRTVAAAGLRALAGESEILPAATELIALVPEADSLARGFDEALARRPDLREVERAARAQALFAQSSRKERLPMLGLEGRFEYGEAGNRDRQDNPFVYEPFNALTLGAVLAVKWDLSFAQSAARARKSAAEAAKLRAEHEGLIARTRVDLAASWARREEALQVYDASRRALSTAANWFRVAEENHGLGTAEVKDVIEGYTAYVRTKGAAIAAVHDLNLAVINWRLEQGRPPLHEGENP